MSEDLKVSRDGAVLTVTFDRPARHNAMTHEMYEALYAAARRPTATSGVKVLVLRGAGGRAFVSGTDISTFRDFRDGADGIAYERRIARVLNRLEDVTVPTVAAIEGYCVGGGLAIAAVCDLRVATRSARFGVPIARTLGNCLSMNSMSILVAQLGPARDARSPAARAVARRRRRRTRQASWPSSATTMLWTARSRASSRRC